MIADTIKLLHSLAWYGQAETIEIAKGKNSIPKNWDDAKEKIVRAKHMQALKGRTQSKNIMQWLLRRKL